MEPIYDSRGQVVGWLRDVHIFNLDGSHAAFIRGEDVYGHRGQHLGIFKNGFFRDHAGGAVAFRTGASGGPILPISSIPPFPPIAAIPPIPAIPAVPPIPAIPSLGWGSTKWEQYVHG